MMGSVERATFKAIGKTPVYENGNGNKPDLDSPTGVSEVTGLIESTTPVRERLLILNLPIVIFERSEKSLETPVSDEHPTESVDNISDNGRTKSSLKIKTGNTESKKRKNLDAEREQVAKAQLGDEEAMGGLYQTYFPRLYFYILARVGNTHLAEDFTEEVFLKVLEALPRYQQGEAPFSAWLFTIAHNYIVSYRRKEKSFQGVNDLIHYNIHEGIMDKANNVEDEVEKKLELERVRQVMQRLPEAQRQVIELRFFAGLTVSETAIAMGKRDGNVKVIQHNAVKRLRKILGVPKRKIGSGGRRV